jgi:hypothetical protein
MVSFSKTHGSQKRKARAYVYAEVVEKLVSSYTLFNYHVLRHKVRSYWAQCVFGPRR